MSYLRSMKIERADVPPGKTDVYPEVPVIWKDDKESKFSFKYIPSMFFCLMKVRLGLYKKPENI